jgi:hypothetical protein
MSMRRDLAKRLEVLEAKAKPRVISSWVDFIPHSAVKV